VAFARIKKEFQNKRVAFGKSAAPLSKREDVDELALIAMESQDHSLLNLFEYLPPLDILKKTRVESQLRRDVRGAVADGIKK
jgi:hypothetical protein